MLSSSYWIIKQSGSQVNQDILTVFDIGARYGVHPSWQRLFSRESVNKLGQGSGRKSILNYHAFDVDPDEVKRLQKKYISFQDNYFAYNLGFSDKKEILELNYLKHKGQSSFLNPNLQSNWFTSRLDESQITSRLQCELTTLREFCRIKEIYPEFLKIDTEGFDLKILKGAGEEVLNGVLAINCEVFFEHTFVEAPLFSQVFDYLLENNFRLANLDYSGKGVPSSYFCPDLNKFGIITGCEAVFIKNMESYAKLKSESKAKLILYLFFNRLEDLAFQLMIKLDTSELLSLRETIIWDEIKICFLLNIKKLQYIPGDSYSKAKIDYRSIFYEEFPEMHNYFEDQRINP